MSKGFSHGLRTALSAKIGLHATDELEKAVTLTAGAVASQNDYQQQAAKMVELADRIDALTIRVEHLERASCQKIQEALESLPSVGQQPEIKEPSK